MYLDGSLERRSIPDPSIPALRSTMKLAAASVDRKQNKSYLTVSLFICGLFLSSLKVSHGSQKNVEFH